MKVIAGISSTALVCLLASCGVQQHNTVSAFVTKQSGGSVSKVNNIMPSNNALTKAIRYETALNMAESIEITMPALSSTMKEGRVVSWLKSEGDEIEAGEAIMVVESDKADMDVEAFEDGFLAKILTDEGETAEVGAIVALVAASEDEIEAVAAGGASSAAAPAAEEAAVEEAPAASGGELYITAMYNSFDEVICTFLQRWCI